MIDLLNSVKERLREALGLLQSGEYRECGELLYQMQRDLNNLEEPTLYKAVGGEFRNVRINELQFKRLVARLGSVPLANYYIRHLSSHMKSRGRSYQDHYATIISWWESDVAHNRLPKPGEEGSTQHGERKYVPKD